MGRSPQTDEGMILLVSILGLIFALQSADSESFPAVGKPAPRLELQLSSGSPLEWKPLSRRKTALFFFCSCEACHEVAKLWAQQEQKKQTQQLKSNTTPQKVIVFAGDADAVQRFQAETGLSGSHVRYACDPEMKAALRYDAMPCPRAFTWDTTGKMLWISPENKGEKPALSPIVLLKSVESAFVLGKKPLSKSLRK